MALVTKTTADRTRLIGTLVAEGLLVTEWTDDPGTEYPEHTHRHAEVRVVLEGSMTVTAAGRAHELGPGDRVDLDPEEPHSAQVGADGVRYLAGSRR